MRPRAQAVRRTGLDVRSLTIAPDGGDDLQHGSAERPQPGLDCLPPHEAAAGVLRSAREWHADAVVWVSAAPGGGAPARALAHELPAWWWPSAWAPGTSEGPLPPLAPGLDPGDAAMATAERGRAGRLSLWDGPYALAATPLGPRESARLFAAFAEAAEDRDEVDLVLLQPLDLEIEALAHEAGIGQRVHFADRAPREAEHAWVQHARLTFVSLGAPLSAGLVHRALAAGCPVMPVGEAAAPVGAWLAARSLSWTRGPWADVDAVAVAAALQRTPAVEAVVQRGRALAAEDLPPGFTQALYAALQGGAQGRGRAA